MSIVVSTGPELAAPVVGVVVRTFGTVDNTIITSPTTGAIAANTLLVAFISANNGNSGSPNTIVNSIQTQSGAALNWTLVQRANAQLGTAEIWSAFTTTSHVATTVRALLSRSEQSSITVVTFTGAASSVGAAHAGVSALNGQPATGLATTRSNSWVYAVGTDWDRARTMTAGPGQTIVNQFNPPAGDTYWVQRTTNPVLVPGFVPVTVTYPGANTDRWNMSLIEIRHP